MHRKYADWKVADRKKKVCHCYLLGNKKQASLRFFVRVFSGRYFPHRPAMRDRVRDLSVAAASQELEMPWSECVYACVVCAVLPLLSLFRIFGNESQPCDPLALVHPILRSFSLLSPARVFLIPRTSPPHHQSLLCLCEVWSNVFIKSEHFNSTAEMSCREAWKDFLTSQNCSRLILSL